MMVLVSMKFFWQFSRLMVFPIGTMIGPSLTITVSRIVCEIGRKSRIHNVFYRSSVRSFVSNSCEHEILQTILQIGTVVHGANSGIRRSKIKVTRSRRQIWRGFNAWRKYRGLAVWLSGNALASINVVALRQTRLVPGWVTVYRQVNYLGT